MLQFFFCTNALITPKIYIILSKHKSIMVEYQVESLRMHFIFTFFNVVYLKYNSTRVEHWKIVFVIAFLVLRSLQTPMRTFLIFTSLLYCCQSFHDFQDCCHCKSDRWMKCSFGIWVSLFCLMVGYFWNIIALPINASWRTL
jgi:hypothetical protein